MSSSININVTEDEIKSMLMRKLTNERCSDAFIDLLIGHIKQSSQGLSQLFKAMLHEYPKLLYNVGDTVWIDVKNLPSWKIDIEDTLKMSEVRDNSIMVKITDINIYQSSPYYIETVAMYSGKRSMITYMIAESTIKYREEDYLEVAKLTEEPDLPF